MTDAALCTVNTVHNVRRRYLEEASHAVLDDKPQPSVVPVFMGKTEVQLTMLACSQSPKRGEYWTLRLLTDKVIELGNFESYSY